MRLDEQYTYVSEGGSIIFAALSTFHVAAVTDVVASTIHSDKAVNQDGESELGANLEPRFITLSGYIRENEIENANRILKIVNPLQTATLYYKNSNYSRRIVCRPEAVPVITEPNESVVLTQFLISLKCSDPFWRDIEQSRVDIAAWLPAFTWPLVVPPEGIIFGYREPSLIMDVLNPGHVPTGMAVVFKASSEVVNPSITNVNTQQYIKLLYTMQAGDVITVNTAYGKQRITLNRSGVESNLFNYLDFDADPDMPLAVGDNLLRYNADSGIEQLEVSIYHEPLYLGVY